MGGAWTINAGGQLYGPFSSERMRSFASEGRLAPTSLVAHENQTDWREARNEPEFADLFAPSPIPDSAPHPGRQTPTAAPPAAPAFGHNPASALGAATDATRAQFAVVLDLKSRGSANFEHAIASLGPHYQLQPNVWIVSSEQSVNAVRNRLIQELGKSDALFVIDATRGKAAWFNFGPDADVRIRRVWQKTG
ncbi:MAG TPA: DUF4339 domain-containing protein [Micropepsaceae bacterium]|nr:DUF4339 domain-containing protein [Micropepsaceae bacterium]